MRKKKKKEKNIPQNHHSSKYDNAVNLSGGIITSYDTPHNGALSTEEPR